MDFEDDADILSRLGILESKEESPRKTTFHSPKKADVSSERDRFVEVNIDGTVETRTDSDEEPVFDRNSLLSPNKGVKVYRRKNETYTCVYLILLLSYIAVGASCPLVWAGFQFDKRTPFSFLLVNSVGLLTGCLTGKLFCRRLSLVFLSFLASVSLCGISWIASMLPGATDARIISALLGFVSGNILYAGLAIWFIYWRGYNRKALLLYILITVGSSIILVTHNQSGIASDKLAPFSPSVTLHKRQADIPVGVADSVMNGINLTEDDLSMFNDTVVTKPKKPQIVEGIRTVETKSDKNEQMRKAVAANKTKAPYNVTSSYITTTTSTIKYVSRFAETTTATRLVTTTRRAMHLDSRTTSHKSSSTSSSVSTPDPPAHLHLDHANIWTTAILSTIVILFYLFTTVFCCLPCSIKSDPKFMRVCFRTQPKQFCIISFWLFDPSIAGLTAGCRLRLASLQVIASFLEGLAEIIAIKFTLQQNANLLLMHYIVVALSRTTIMVLGPIAYSLNGCCIVLFGSVLGSLLLMLDVASSSIGLILVSGSTGIFALMVFLYIEMCVSPRAGTQLDYFSFSMMVGRCLCSALAALMPFADASQIISVILLVNAPLIVLFTLLVKSLRKAARLKEIMEYSSSPVLEAVGEYVSLVERDEDSDSAEEDDGHGIAG